MTAFDFINTRHDSERARPLDVVTTVSAVAAGCVVAFVSAHAGESQLPLLVGVGTAVGVVLLLFVAAHQMEKFVISILVLRPALDDMAHDDLGLFQPASALGLLLLGIAACWIGDRFRTKRLRPVSGMVKAFIVYAALITMSAPASMTPVLSMTGSLKLWSSVLLLFVLEQLFQDNPDRLWRFLGAAALGLVVPVLTALVQILSTGSTDPVSGLVRIDGPFVHSNPFATYLVVGMLLATAILLRGDAIQRKIAGAVLVCAGPVLVLTYARAGWGALVIGLIFIARYLDRRVLGWLGAACLLMVMSNPSVVIRIADLAKPDSPSVTYDDPNSLEWRVGYWAEILPLSRSNPLTGTGLDTVEQMTAVGLPPHNSFVQAFVEAGILGLGGLIGAVVACSRLLKRALARRDNGIEGAIAVGTAAAALSVFLQLFTENLITGLVPLWYVFLPMAWLSANQLGNRYSPTHQEPDNTHSVTDHPENNHPQRPCEPARIGV